MPFDEFKYRVIAGLFDMAGNFISGHITKPTYEDHEKITDEYYDKMKQVARETDKRADRERRRIIEEPVEQEEQARDTEAHGLQEKRDLTQPKIEGGTACLPCSRDHFSTVSGALTEAIRFSRREGVQHKEVQRRLGMSLDELNMLERIDLSPEETVRLKGKEKHLAEWGLNKSRELRHKITAVQNHEDLERVAAMASQIRTEFMRNLWDIATVDGSIQKLCKGLKDEEYQRCVSTINEILVDKKETPP